jgi:alkylhydroperoxidase family enzyme
VEIMTQLGIPKSQIEELDSPKNLTDREKLALRFTESVMKNSLEITDSFFENLRSLFSQEEIVELTFLIGYINMLNYFNNALQVTYQGDYDS